VIADSPYRPVSPRFWVARQAQLAGLGALLLAGALALSAASPGPAGPTVAACSIAFVAVAWGVERGRYRAWGYAERADDLVVRRGLLFRRISVVPYGRMQFIDVTAGPVDRLFGLATVQLHTAAAATDARIPGLSVGDALQLRDRLASVGEAQATGL
jgi:membrane protein YdbS with pleckstrin-like domain